MNGVLQWLSNHLKFLVFKLHFSGCLKLCFLLCSLIYLLPSCDYWSLSRPCAWSPLLSCQAKSMAQEPEGPRDISVMLGCLLAASGGLQCEVSPSSVSPSPQIWLIKFCLLNKKCGRKAVQVQIQLYSSYLRNVVTILDETQLRK